ncbi:hypothetical protein RQP46_009516 [Phenoliferia psychrophenolica]
MNETTVTATFDIALLSDAERSYPFTFTSLEPFSAVAGSESWMFSHSGVAPLRIEIEVPYLPGTISLTELKCRIGTRARPSSVSNCHWDDLEHRGPFWHNCSILGHPSNLRVKITATFVDTYEEESEESETDSSSDSGSDEGDERESSESEAISSNMVPASIVAKLAHRLLSSPSIGDVQFRFTRDGATRSLWANAANLRQISPYYASLLSDSFQEGALKNSSASIPTEAACNDDDSDDDSDLTLPHLPSATSALHPVHTVDITAHSYWTYRAVLGWTTSSHILFAPLTSTFSPADPTDISSPMDLRINWIEEAVAENSETGSVPVSPKSVYRLAHFLELDALKSIALAAIKSNLRASNVLQELLGETSSAYEEVREVELNFALANWAEVRKQEGAKEWLARMDDGSTEGILLKLAMGLRI